MLDVETELAMTRLLTLTGAGGSGKTRLALEVARGLVGAYPDGVWLVELAPLSEEALVPKAVSEALGVPERSAEPLADTLADVLRAPQDVRLPSAVNTGGCRRAHRMGVRPWDAAGPIPASGRAWRR
jgi:predicted ATPase